MKWAVTILMVLWPLSGLAQSVAEQAQAAAAQLDRAAAQLDQADSARNRVKALSETVLAYESGLSAMRDGLRGVVAREEQLSRKLKASDGEIAQFLGVLQSIGPDPSPDAFFHPQGPTGTARAGMILSELTPALNARASQLRDDLQEVQTLRALQQAAADQLQIGLSDVQRARVSLNRAMAERTDLPQRFTEDPVRTAILIASSETLTGFASGLSQITRDDQGVDLPPLDDRIGGLTLPVQGLVLRGANEPDAAGITRPGLIIATRPGALVSAPTAATIRYTGPLLDYGNVVILEPGTDTLFVLAGLDVTYGAAGNVIAEGTPLGLMGGLNTGSVAENGASSQASLSTDGDGAGNGRTETLYIEVRQQNVPQDPASWFGTDKDG